MFAPLNSPLEEKHVHLVGIKGVAMTSLAQCLDDLGITVTGSDVSEEFVTQDILIQRGFKLYEGFAPSHITPDVDLVVYTGAHKGSKNIEVLEAKNKKIPFLSHAEALGQLMDTKKGISVCGTGGKSTISSMISWILEQAGKNPSYSVGVGNIPNLGKTGKYRKESEYFVAEADEYAVDPTSDHRPRFIYQHPQVIVCPNLSYDHPDIYPTFETMKETFLSFFLRLPEAGWLIVNGDDPNLAELIQHIVDINDTHLLNIIRVGFGPQNDIVLSEPETIAQKTRCTITFSFSGAPQTHTLELPIPGTFNLHNAALAIGAVLAIDTDANFHLCQKALTEFKGTMRRFEHKGKINGANCYDDYAHTPDEIRATLKALQKWSPNKKVVVAFQPHTYSRTKALYQSFVSELANADQILLLDIFSSARELPDPTISSQKLVLDMKLSYPEKSIEYIPNTDDLSLWLQNNLDESCVFITLGAGDIYKVYDTVLTQN